MTVDMLIARLRQLANSGWGDYEVHILTELHDDAGTQCEQVCGDVAVSHMTNTVFLVNDDF